MVKTRTQAEAAAADDTEQRAAYVNPNVRYADSPRSPSTQPAGPSRQVELPAHPLSTLRERAAASVAEPGRAEPRRQRSPAASHSSSTGEAPRRRAHAATAVAGPGRAEPRRQRSPAASPTGNTALRRAQAETAVAGPGRAEPRRRRSPAASDCSSSGTARHRVHTAAATAVAEPGRAEPRRQRSPAASHSSSTGEAPRRRAHAATTVAGPGRAEPRRRRSPAASHCSSSGTARHRVHAAAATAVAEPERTEPRRQRSPAASRCSTARSTARRRTQLELEAQEQLAVITRRVAELSRREIEITRRELEDEAELVRKRLASEVEQLDDDRASVASRAVYDRVDKWLGQADETKRWPVTTTQEGTAAAVPPAPFERRGELRVTRRDDRRHEPARPTYAPRNKTPHRPRSPTPDKGADRPAPATEKSCCQVQQRAYDLPTFTGAPGEWLPFQTTMRDTTLLYRVSPVENLVRLRQCLKGRARESVLTLLHTAESPDVVMATLEQCYGRPEMLIKRAFEEMRMLSKVGTSAADLNDFAVKVQNIVSALAKLDEKGYLYNPTLVHEILTKLSPYMQSAWCNYASEQASPDAPVVTLSRFLMDQAGRAMKYNYLEALTGTPTPSAAATARPAGKNTAGPARNRARGAPVYAAAEEEQRTPEDCPCCGGGHRIAACRKLRDMDNDARWEWARSTRVCFKCISNKHRRIKCKAPACGTNGCRRPHHRLLHSDVDQPAHASSEAPAASATAGHETEAVMSIAATSEGRSVLLKVCRVVIAGPAGEVATYALLDEGSTVTLIDRELADSIGAIGTPAPLNLRGVNAMERQEDSRRVTLQIRGQQEPTEHTMAARTVRGLDLRRQSVPRDITRYAHLRRLRHACYADAKPRVLIGADNWHLTVSRQVSMGAKNEPAASRTDLGWVVYGTMPRLLHRADDDTALHIHAAERRTEPATPTTEGSSDDQLHELVKQHFAVDALGVSRSVKVKPEDQRAIEIFGQTARRVDGRFEVGLPWRTDDVALPPNYGDALNRLRGIERKMDGDPTFREEYTKQITNLLDKGYAARCDGSERDHARQWFLPHFAVRNPNKPGKVRLVFDAAHKSQGTSLNDKLLEGPDLLLSLPGVLFRFREQAVAVTADIAEMFLRIKIRREDQPAQLFLWRGDDRSHPPDCYKMTSMIFGASSSPFLAHSVRNKNAHDHAHTHPRALPIITGSHYMDDLVHSFDSTEEARLAVSEVIEVHRRADFTLRGWNSNCARLLNTIPEELRARQPTALGSSEARDEKTLGMLWDAANDELGFNTALARVPEPVRARQRTPTKREALATVMSIFDPLGLLSSYTVTAKILLQDLWRIQLGWDDALPPAYAERFSRWLEDLGIVAQLRLPRRYDECDDDTGRELHVFVDASEQAYAAAAYWRLQHTDGRIVVTLAAAKAKVAPLRPQTIPRLELQAAVIGARLADMIRREHRWPATRVVYWSDSRTVVQWIRTDARRYTPYVAHRLGEIAELTEVDQWRWVPTDLNVADDATRPENTPSDQHDRWFSGPSFLYEPEDTWPVIPAAHSDDIQEDAHHASDTGGAGALPDISRFSTYERLIRATAAVLRFIDRCRKTTTSLELRHLERAEQLWVAQAQRDSFSAEIDRLSTGRALPATSRLTRLDPVLEDGLLRVRGRIDAANAPISAKRPLIIDGRHPLTRLMVLREHAAAGHASNERVLNDLRQRVWILRARPTVRAVARTCALCRVRRAKPRVPPTGDLPPARLDPYCRPFTNCGVDYFGPMLVKVGRRREKRWGALFTCLTTRAVHIELVGSLTIDSAIMALRRMAARRGWPRQMWSDNGTNFRGADAELRAAYREWAPALRERAQLQRVDWRFIPPGAPNQGGAWERLVRSIKTALSATLREQVPPEEVLHTLLLEAEHAVNARPLTHVSTDPADPEALTPNHFLIGASTGLPQAGPCDPADRKKWRAVQGLADQFWRRWVREYLPTLVPRGGASDGQQPLREGDLVLVVDPSLPRNTWPRGVVKRVHTGPDGDVRSAEIQTKGGVFVRPTRKLAVLPV